MQGAGDAQQEGMGGMRLDEGAETEGISATRWVCSARLPESIIPNNTIFVEKILWVGCWCATHKEHIMLQKNVLSKGLIRALMGPVTCTVLPQNARISLTGCGCLLWRLLLLDVEVVHVSCSKEKTCVPPAFKQLIWERVLV